MDHTQIPEPLKQAHRWVCYDAQKHPINPVTGKGAMSNNPATWATFEQAAEAVTRLGCRGLGFLLGDGFSGVDIDHCIDQETGTASEMAADIVSTMDSYTELSPSGTGLHILFQGSKPDGACKSSALGLEMYGQGRYFTVTGKPWGERRELAERSTQAAAVHAKYLVKVDQQPVARPARTTIALDDQELLRRAAASRDGDRFSALMAGSWQAYYASQSEADLGLCNLLAFWFGCDVARMDNVFRSSGLFRAKWDERRGANTYGQIT